MNSFLLAVTLGVLGAAPQSPADGGPAISSASSSAHLLEGVDHPRPSTSVRLLEARSAVPSLAPGVSLLVVGAVVQAASLAPVLVALFVPVLGLSAVGASLLILGGLVVGAPIALIGLVLLTRALDARRALRLEPVGARSTLAFDVRSTGLRPTALFTLATF